MSFNCKKCGQELPDDAQFCSSCGQKQKRGNTVKRATNWVLAKPKRLAIAAIVILLIVSGITMVPENNTASITSDISSRFATTSSEVSEEAKDIKAFNEATNELKRCEGEELVDIIDIAKEYDYEYTLINYDGEECTDAYEELDGNSQEQWEVLQVEEVDQNNRELSLMVDTKDRIAGRETEALNKCLNQPVTTAQSVIDEHEYSYELQNAAGEDCKASFAALSTEQKTHWIVTGVKEIDTDNKTVLFTADTKENIAAAKKAAEEKAKQEAAAKKAARAKQKKKAAQAQTRSSGGGTVWIPRTGSKYHSNQYCSNMKNPSQVTEAQARSMGYEPCKKCY